MVLIFGKHVHTDLWLSETLVNYEKLSYMFAANPPTCWSSNNLKKFWTSPSFWQTIEAVGSCGISNIGQQFYRYTHVLYVPTYPSANMYMMKQRFPP